MCVQCNRSDWHPCAYVLMYNLSLSDNCNFAVTVDCVGDHHYPPGGDHPSPVPYEKGSDNTK